MFQQRHLVKNNPFNKYVCDTCGVELGEHWLFRPDKFADVRPDGDGRKPNGRLYCHRDQLGWAGNYHQRELKQIAESGYTQERARV